MGLSNYLPSSRLIQPGVCTSTTRPASPFNGQVIYETDTKQTLVWQGSLWVMLTNADAPPGLELVKTQTVGTGVSSVTVSNCFSSTYDNYKIVWSNIDCSTGGVSMYVKIGSAATGYYGSQAYWTYGGATGVNNQNNATILYCGSSDTTTCSGWFELQGPYTTTYTHMSGMSYGSGASTLNMGALENTTSYTAFTFGPGAGTMTGGIITVYGYRKA